MTNERNSRVRFFEKQFLRAQDLTDEQAYHLVMHRRHNIAQHSWGIVSGLEIKENCSFFLAWRLMATGGN